MQLLDILSHEKWVMLEKRINNRSGLNAAVFNSEGQRITQFVKWANRLCPVIKSDKLGQSYICAAAHQNIAAQAKKLHKPIIEACDAGLMKLVVPIFVKDEFLGVASGCGCFLDDNEIDVFMIQKTTGLEESAIEDRSQDIPKLTQKQIEPLVEFIRKEVEQIVIQYENSLPAP